MRLTHAIIAGMSMSCVACTAGVSLPDAPTQAGDSIVVGRVITVITGDSSRIYGPQMRFFELENQQTHQRFNVDITSDDQVFSFQLAPGDYRLTRVQISEGPFMSMADVGASFAVGQGAVTYVGTWRFGIDSPRYGRMMALSMVLDADDRARSETDLFREHPLWSGVPTVSVIPEPATMETRLYEVMPYPRYPRYFRRHNF